MIKINFSHPLLIFSVGFLLGAMWYKFRIFPIPQISHWKSNRISVVEYNAGDPLFYDRSYYDESGNTYFNGFYLIKITRHRKAEDLITIKVKTPVTIYRLLSRSNNNQFLHQYEATDIKVRVEGHLSTHSEVVKKQFTEGDITLSPGAGQSSSPILVNHSGLGLDNFQIKILSSSTLQ